MHEEQCVHRVANQPKDPLVKDMIMIMIMMLVCVIIVIKLIMIITDVTNVFMVVCIHSAAGGNCHIMSS